jgi:alpha-glucosidase
MNSPVDARYFQRALEAANLQRIARGLEMDVDAERLRVEALREDVLRIKISCGGVFDEQPSAAVCADTGAMDCAVEVEETAELVRLRTTAMTLTIYKEPFRLDAHRADGSVIFESAADRDGNYWTYATLNDSFLVTRRCEIEDAIYGLGEKTGAFDRKGRNFTLWNTDVLNPTATGEFVRNHRQGDPRADPTSTEFDPYYVSIPFFYHQPHGQAAMAGFFFDNPYRADFEFAGRREYRVHFHGGQYTEYVFAGPAMRDILAAYTQLTGRMPPPPRWALGHHQCRWHAYTQEKVEALAQRYREKGIPCDVLWLDIDYMDGYRVFTWNKETFPATEEMLGRLRGQGLRVVTIVDPGVKCDPGYRVYDEAVAGDLLCRTPGGSQYVGQVWPGRTVFPDFSLEETRHWWGRLNAEHVKSGLAGIWNDMNEPATGEVPAEQMTFGRGKFPHARFHNEYAMLMAMGTVEGLHAAMPDRRTFVLSRAGSAGIQRYAANWMGDNCSRWEHLEMSVPMAMGFGVSGQAFVGADIGGFTEDCSAELLARWYQCGALTPFCRNHNAIGQRDQYPWAFGGATEAVCRAAVELRYRLMPYIYTQFLLASETGAPVQRPLVFDYQDDVSVRHVDDEYLFGGDLLVAPVYRKGETARQAYLPAGTWHDWRTGAKLAGRRWITAAASLDTIPLYARGGSVIPMWPEAPVSTMDYRPTVLELHVFLPYEDGESSSVLHEDDGETFAFRDGAFYRTVFTLTKSSDAIALRAEVSGRGYAAFARREFRVIFHGEIAPQILVDGQPHTATDDRLVLANVGTAFHLQATIIPS